jgi:hypothetical protein
MEKITYEPIDPADLHAGSYIQELALALGYAPSTIVGWRKTGLPATVNNALRHIMFLEANEAHARERLRETETALLVLARTIK